MRIEATQYAHISCCVVEMKFGVLRVNWGSDGEAEGVAVLQFQSMHLFYPVEDIVSVSRIRATRCSCHLFGILKQNNIR